VQRGQQMSQNLTKSKDSTNISNVNCSNSLQLQNEREFWYQNLTEEEHPGLGYPCYTLHICGLKEKIQSLTQSQLIPRGEISTITSSTISTLSEYNHADSSDDSNSCRFTSSNIDVDTIDSIKCSHIIGITPAVNNESGSPPLLNYSLNSNSSSCNRSNNSSHSQDNDNSSYREDNDVHYREHFLLNWFTIVGPYFGLAITPHLYVTLNSHIS